MENVCLSIFPEVYLSNLLFAVLSGTIPSDVTNSCSRYLETPSPLSRKDVNTIGSLEALPS
jgi:hypothetical protein